MRRRYSREGRVVDLDWRAGEKQSFGPGVLLPKAAVREIVLLVATQAAWRAKFQ